MICKEIIRCSGQTGQAYQRGPKGAIMTNLSVFDSLGPSGPFFDHFRRKFIFCSEAPLPNPTLSIWGKKSFLSEMVQKGPDGPKRGPK